MPVIAAVGTAVPRYVLHQKDVKQFARDMYGNVFPDIDRLVGVYDNAQIEQRHFCVPLDWFGSRKSFREKNDLYITNALSLSERAIEDCLNRANVSYEEPDYIMFVSTTGLATPSIDAQLMERLPFRRDIKRLPIWGLGCAGGAASLSRAMEIARAVPTARILVVVVELCGLTFMHNDFSKAALIATALFGDGAAAVLIEGDEVDHNEAGPQLLASATNTMPNSLDVMGWDIGEEGFKIVISRDIPLIVKTFMRDSIDGFLEANGLELGDIEHFVTHPGGAKVLEAYQEALDHPPEKFRHTWEVLRRYGNMSASSILFVLERFMCDDGVRAAGGYGILGALGPGFSSELVLIRW